MKKFLSLAILLFCLGSLQSCQKSSQEPQSNSATAQKKNVDWQTATRFEVLPNASLLTTKVTRDGDVPVVGTLNVTTGFLDFDPKAAPAAQMGIDATSWNSDLVVRNQRVREIFFQADEKPYAEIKLSLVQLPEDALAKLREAKNLEAASVTAQLEFYGQTKEISAQVTAKITDKGNVLVTSVAPVMIKISEWELSDNLKELMSICGAQSISDDVSVIFALQFAPVSD